MSASTPFPRLVGAAGLVLALVSGAAGFGAGPASARPTGPTFLAASNTAAGVRLHDPRLHSDRQRREQRHLQLRRLGQARRVRSTAASISPPTAPATHPPALPCSRRPTRRTSTTRSPRAPCREEHGGGAKEQRRPVHRPAFGDVLRSKRWQQRRHVVPRYRLHPRAVHHGTPRDLLVPQRRQHPRSGAGCSHVRRTRRRLSSPRAARQRRRPRWPRCGRDLLAHTNRPYGGSARRNVGGYLAIADPKNGWVFADTGCGPSNVAPNAPYGLAGMEALYVAAVGYYHAHPHKALGATASDQACAEIDQMTDKASSLDNYNTTSPSSGGQNGNGNYSDPTLPIIFGDNVTYTQDTRRRRHLADRAASEVVRGSPRPVTTPTSGPRSPSAASRASPPPRCRTAGRPTSPTPSPAPTGTTSPGCTTTSRPRSAPRNFGKSGAQSPKTLVGQHGYYQPIRQWVVVENDDQGQDCDSRPDERRRQIRAGLHPLSAFRQGSGRVGLLRL